MNRNRGAIGLALGVSAITLPLAQGFSAELNKAALSGYTVGYDFQGNLSCTLGGLDDCPDGRFLILEGDLTRKPIA